jgi:hypothetical protein
MPAASAYGRMSCQTTFSLKAVFRMCPPRLMERNTRLSVMPAAVAHASIATFDPGRHWHRSHPAVLADQIHDAPPAPAASLAS